MLLSRAAEGATAGSPAALVSHTGPTRKRLAIGAATMSAGNIFKVGIQAVMLPLMAHLVGPAAYGLYTLALPTITFVMMPSDAGLGTSLAREAPEARAVWSSAFWAVHGLAALLAIGVIAWSFLLGHLMRQPQLPAIMSTLSVTLLLLAANVLPGARLLREGRIHVGAIVDVVATATGAGAALLLAWLGAGTWALVAQYVTAFTVRAAGMNAVAFHAPALTFRPGLLRPHLAFGGAIVCIKLVEYFGRLIETALVSLMLGTSALGLYGFAVQVPRFLCESASNPIWSVLYVLTLQRPQAEIEQTFYRLCRGLGLILFPATFLAGAASPEIIALFLGPSWRPVALPLAFLLLTSSFATIGAQTSALLFAKGRSDVQIWISLGMVVGRVLAAASTGLAGLTGAALLLGIVNLAGGYAALAFPARTLGLSPSKVIAGLSLPCLAALLAAASTRMLLGELGPGLLSLSAALVVSSLVYVGVLMATERRRLVEDLAGLRVSLRQPAAI